MYRNRVFLGEHTRPEDVSSAAGRVRSPDNTRQPPVRATSGFGQGDHLMTGELFDLKLHHVIVLGEGEFDALRF